MLIVFIIRRVFGYFYKIEESVTGPQYTHGDCVDTATNSTLLFWAFLFEG
jgi:hypothetical protein